LEQSLSTNSAGDLNMQTETDTFSQESSSQVQTDEFDAPVLFNGKEEVGSDKEGKASNEDSTLNSILMNGGNEDLDGSAPGSEHSLPVSDDDTARHIVKKVPVNRNKKAQNMNPNPLDHPIVPKIRLRPIHNPHLSPEMPGPSRRKNTGLTSKRTGQPLRAKNILLKKNMSKKTIPRRGRPLPEPDIYPEGEENEGELTRLRTA